MPDKTEAVRDPDINKNTYRPIEIVRDPDGVIATITARERDGRVTFMIQREFDRDGKTVQTAFLARRHIAAVRRILNDLEERLEQVEDQERARHR